MTVTIAGIQQAQQANLDAIAALKPSGNLGRAVQYGTLETHRYLTAITHVDSGTLRASHRVENRGLHGRVYVDPAAVNPRTREKPSVYVMDEERRGGSHAMYSRTYQEAGRRIAQATAEGFVRGLR